MMVMFGDGDVLMVMWVMLMFGWWCVVMVTIGDGDVMMAMFGYDDIW